MEFTRQAMQVLRDAVDQCRARGIGRVETGHLLYCLCPALPPYHQRVAGVRERLWREATRETGGTAAELRYWRATEERNPPSESARWSVDAALREATGGADASFGPAARAALRRAVEVANDHGAWNADAIHMLIGAAQPTDTGLSRLLAAADATSAALLADPQVAEVLGNTGEPVAAGCGVLRASGAFVDKPGRGIRLLARFGGRSKRWDGQPVLSAVAREAERQVQRSGSASVADAHLLLALAQLATDVAVLGASFVPEFAGTDRTLTALRRAAGNPETLQMAAAEIVDVRGESDSPFAAQAEERLREWFAGSGIQPVQGDTILRRLLEQGDDSVSALLRRAGLDRIALARVIPPPQ
ncbi:hypothetical protein GCM10010123_29640 [Pilimelia anulata]|uniref:Uncharacterized protein n=1 Tax=Pilimelia anulata TaxID=53371 RepID=A0A8J3B6V7_9ACTN|nr:hypothetical protein [Pilimelia anulata]GGJ97690.1 hypothetical protein GCM10010123_29640 [Pilimelia anulata]